MDDPHDLSCSPFEARTVALSQYIDDIRNGSGGYEATLKNCQKAICRGIFGVGNPDMSGIGVGNPFL